MNNSLVVAITGGIGTGKSTVSKLISEKGYKVISSDDTAKELMVNDPVVRKKIIAEFGEGFYKPDGSLNKAAVAATIFGEDEKSERSLAKLNSIVHPQVIEQMINSVEELEKAGEKMIFVESALVFEAELEEGFEYILVVDAPEDLCIERVQQRSGGSPEQIRQQMNAQLPQSEKVSHADFVIDNSSDLEKLTKAVDFILQILENILPA